MDVIYRWNLEYMPGNCPGAVVGYFGENQIIAKMSQHIANEIDNLVVRKLLEMLPLAAKPKEPAPEPEPDLSFLELVIWTFPL